MAEEGEWVTVCRSKQETVKNKSKSVSNHDNQTIWSEGNQNVNKQYPSVRQHFEGDPDEKQMTLDEYKSLRESKTKVNAVKVPTGYIWQGIQQINDNQSADEHKESLQNEQSNNKRKFISIPLVFKSFNYETPYTSGSEPPKSYQTSSQHSNRNGQRRVSRNGRES
ncbi:unnamed protein product [Rotaria socialis]|uniref:Hyaluronan/mRNA-binding protein domain-containing protein n=1 Tax=Rotaria socialis TaxID=392032 RepID=A0A818GHZ3_9BILA|nr:unnamed protein product [Rotaria socialis]